MKKLLFIILINGFVLGLVSCKTVSTEQESPLLEDQEIPTKEEVPPPPLEMDTNPMAHPPQDGF